MAAKEAQVGDVEATGKKAKPIVKIATYAVGALVLVGAGFGAGMFASGSGVHAPGEAQVDPNRPKLVPRGGEEGEEAVTAGGSKYETSYFEIEKNFTSNLKDSARYVQATLGVATHYDQRVIANLEKHEVAVRSAILAVLADQPEDGVTSIDGKAQLQKKLADAINKVLMEKEGFGGVGEVYFTSFIVQ